MISTEMLAVSMVGVFLLIAAMNLCSLRKKDALEVTSSAALLVNFVLGALTALGHFFTPVAGAIVMTMLVMKTELNRFTGGLHRYNGSPIAKELFAGSLLFVMDLQNAYPNVHHPKTILYADIKPYVVPFVDQLHDGYHMSISGSNKTMA